MYSHLYTQMIRTEQEQIAARAINRHVQDVPAVTASRRGGVRRAGNAIAVFGVCVAAITGVAVSNASGQSSAQQGIQVSAQSGAQQRIHVSAQQLRRETSALESVGFVPTSCEVGGTLMTNERTKQSLLLPW
jgi:phosphoribosyl-dephospho-CoA transferase